MTTLDKDILKQARLGPSGLSMARQLVAVVAGYKRLWMESCVS